MRLRIILDKIIEYSFYGLFFFTPLIFNPIRAFPSFELFEWNKMMFVYVMTTLIIATWLAKMILNKKILITRSPFDLFLLLFLLSQFLSTIFSIDPHVSLFGYYSRFHGGLLSTICYTLLFFAFTANTNLIKLPRLVMYSLASGVVVAGYGIAQRYGIDANIWVQDVRARVFSTLGQPNWLAALLAILLPVTIHKTLSNIPGFELITKKIKTSSSQSSRKNQNVEEIHFRSLSDNSLPAGKAGIIGIYLIIGLLLYICLLFTKSRSGFLGFWIPMLVFWTILFWIKRKKIHSFVPLFLILNSLFLILNFFIRTPFPQYNKYFTNDILQKTKVVEETAPPPGETIINVGITDSANIRRIVWQGAFDIIKAYPVFGTGPETFAYAYYRFRPAAHNLTSEWDFLYNRAHNEFLNIAATSGLMGLGTYIILILSIFITSLKSLLFTTDYELRTMNLALITAYTSILITNFFGFSVVVVGLYFFLIPAFLWKLNSSHTQDAVKTTTLDLITPTPAKLISLCILLITTAFIFSQLVKLWYVDSLYAKSLTATKLQKFDDSYTYINQAVLLRPDEPVYHDEKANVANTLAEAAFSQNEATLAGELAKEAITESKLALTISPQNVIFWKTRTRVLFLLSDYANEFTDEALNTILVAQKLAPTDPRIAYNVGVLYGKANKNQEAIEALLNTIKLKPDYRDAYIALSIFYEEEKQVDKAREALNLILERINKDDKEVKERLEKLNK